MTRRSITLTDQTWVALILVAALLLPWMWLVGTAWAKWSQYHDLIQRDLPRLARLQGQVDMEAPLRQQLQQVRDHLAGQTYPAQLSGTQVLGDLQARVRGQIQAAGLELQGTDQHSPRMEGTFERFSITLSIGGTLPQVIGFLQALDGESPAIFVEQVQLQPAILVSDPEATPPQRVNMTLRLAVMRQT
ncbi:Type II secretion system (T2SS), protein M subtype b [Ectothiorhodospira magna]|uniref:Type II secretion system (T2SS), protein M subtype b n=1 Tax=Ectothiorhodospira magna TaxID=867345 RepID=A0A1H9BJJ1_9GAMM|nr:type II secretion system protein GspM [Ectothiorhodospira magna]SEP88887.1 Type II secretion system (T2SS), protein M subtype b [Ectothiorhodospira magna]